MASPVRSAGARWSVVALVLVTLLFFAIGFLLLPAATADFGREGLWDSICRAAGVSRAWIAPTRSVAPSARSTDVVLVPASARTGGSDAVGRGATIAVQRCSMCHGAQGMSGGDAPNLAGQYPEVVSKQLHDYRRGDREHALMQALAVALSDRDIADLAAYYDSLPKARTAPARYSEKSAPALVRVGDPMRNIAPCIACHGGIDHKLGAPWLEGMPREYLLRQMREFQTGTRRNDSFAQMRNMARALSDAEVSEVVEFYARRTDARE
ncbi:MAG: c-type cytochrome [Burkholderiales bacterium]